MLNQPAPYVKQCLYKSQRIQARPFKLSVLRRSWTFLNVSQEKTKRFGRKTVGSLLQHQAGIWSRGCYKDRRAQHHPLFSSAHEHKWRPQIAIRPYCVNLGFPCHAAFFGSDPLIISQLENQLAFFLYLGVNT